MTIETETETRGRFADLDDEALIDMVGACLEQETQQRDQRQRLEWTLQRRMEARDATEIPHSGFTCKLVTPTPSYDPNKLRLMAEYVPKEVFAEGFTEAYEETVQFPAKFNMTKVKTWDKFGETVKGIRLDAMLPQPPKLQVKPRAQ